MKNFFKKMANVIVNGVKHEEAISLKVYGNKVYVNGNEVTPMSKNIQISVEGNIENLEVDSCGTLKINGDVEMMRTASGDVDVTGNVSAIGTASGEVTVKGNVNSNISTASGDVEVKGHVYGKISTMSGDIECECVH